VATAPILYDTHLIANFDITTETTVSYRAYSKDIRLFGRLSIVKDGLPGIPVLNGVARHCLDGDDNLGG